MLSLRQDIVHAFAEGSFRGNPAAVVVLDVWPKEQLMLHLAQDNNLSETTFLVKEKEGWHIRWFTPVAEVKLCGHATLASGKVLHERKLWDAEQTISLKSRSGLLKIAYENEDYVLDFPAQKIDATRLPPGLEEALRCSVSECYGSGEDFLVLLDDEETVSKIKPDFSFLKKINCRGVTITAKSDKYDFVSRFFAPGYGIDEDPVTGSAHCTLAPFWAERLHKSEMLAAQVSSRGGLLRLRVSGDRVFIAGKAKHFSQALIESPFTENIA